MAAEGAGKVGQDLLHVLGVGGEGQLLLAHEVGRLEHAVLGDEGDGADHRLLPAIGDHFDQPATVRAAKVVAHGHLHHFEEPRHRRQLPLVIVVAGDHHRRDRLPAEVTEEGVDDLLRLGAGGRRLEDIAGDEEAVGLAA